jgi:aldehyde dehydrogenase family protein
VSLLDDLQWQSRVFTGSWQPSAGGDAAVVEPATGNELRPGWARGPHRLGRPGGRDLFDRTTVLADAGPSIPACQQEVFGPAASVTPFATLDDAVKLASDSEYGLSLGILTREVARGLARAERIPTGSRTSTTRPSTMRATRPWRRVGFRHRFPLRRRTRSKTGPIAAPSEARAHEVCPSP